MKKVLEKIGIGFILTVFSAVSIALVAVSLSGCALIIVQGNGNVTTESRTLTGAFTNVSADSTVDVVIVRGSSYSATVEIDSNLQRYVELELGGNTLHVTNPEAVMFSATRAVVRIVMPALEEAATVGTGDLLIQDFDTGAAIELRTTGTGDVSYSGTAFELSAIVEGTGAVLLEGDAVFLNVSIAGTGDVDAYAFFSDYANVSIAGTGNAVVYANETVTAVLSGTGDLDVYGPADVDSTTTGLGHVYIHD